MNGKKSPIIFAVLIIMLVVLIIVAVVILTKKPQSPVTPDKPTDLAVPEIELSIDTTEPEQDKVVITCKATIDDEPLNKLAKYVHEELGLYSLDCGYDINNEHCIECARRNVKK